jgi:phage-related tail fiber protein
MKISILRQTKEALDGVLDLKAFDVKTTHVPTEDDSLVNKAYVDSVAAGLDVKASVVVATTTTDGPLSDGNLELGTGGLLTIDGVTLTAGDRVLVKNQTDPTENGIYVADAGAWSRSDDQDGTPLANVSSGNFTFVEQGTLNSGTGWVLGGAAEKRSSSD